MCQMFFPTIARGRTLDKTQFLPTYCLSREGDRCAGRLIQHNMVCMVCIRPEIYIACAGSIWERFLLKMGPELNFEGQIKVGKLKKGKG